MDESTQNICEKYPAALPKDTILAGKYIIKDVLGQGSFGITYLAEDYETGAKAAVKEFFPETMAMRGTTSIEVKTYTDERLENFRFGMESFLKEAEALAQFQGNPHIVGVQKQFEENGTAYFVMDYIEGIDFKTYIEQNSGKLPWEEVWKIMSPIMDALDTIHKKGLIHCDVTPDNILISNDGTVKLIDFGAARYSLADRSENVAAILKPGYTPKEQYLRHGREGSFTDVHYVAVCFYTALSGCVPPDAPERMFGDKNLVPLRSYDVKVPPNAEAVIIKGMAVRPEERFQSMAELKTELAKTNLFLGLFVRPDDLFSEKFFGSDMVKVSNRHCKYKMEVYGPAAGKKPYISKRSSLFKIDDTHIYSKTSSSSWYAVSTMKTPMVKTSPLKSMALSPYHLSQMAGQPELVLNLPKGRNIDSYQSICFHCLDSWEEYNRMHGFEESEPYCHIFMLNGKLYRDYILCARKDIYAWKVECYLEAMNGSTQIDVTDFVPVGYTFGTFFPLI